ncbi:MAG TPA: tryptophan 2,3-dioxygenase family protein [Thermoanaerobaculia bacterium]|jgi:tryptophan 2,3-dioxygenase|nr:tryptophan 2,3-dioxygenase family protein [Thermoanaerobaculia bacterium]
MPHTGPILEGRGNTDYERYVRVPELLELQKPVELLSNPEERLFQVMHQTAELWLHHIDYEIDRTVVHLESDEPELAADLLHRSRLIIDLLREQIIILETMAPVDYHVLRTTSLGRGSGQESPGFRRLLDVGKRVWPHFEALLRKRSVTVLELERNPKEHYPLFRLLQAMMDYDEAFMKWRFTHMRLAFRIIGDRVHSLKGVPAAQLEAGTREPLFPELWSAISDLTAEWKPTY